VSFWHLTKADIRPVFHTPVQCLKEVTESLSLTRLTQSLKKQKNKNTTVKEISTSSRHTASMKGGVLNISIAILPQEKHTQYIKQFNPFTHFFSPL